MFNQTVALLFSIAGTSPLQQLEQYVIIVSEDQYQELNRELAIADGIDTETLELATQIIEYQNTLIDRSYSTEFEYMDLEQDLRDFPAIRNFYDTQLMAYAAHPCGNFTHPVPNHAPGRTAYYGIADPVSLLIASGFHRTAGYACGKDGLPQCLNDFTRPRSYSGPYGFCASPMFRDHGHADPYGSYISLQLGEPNPEVHTYIWPYWDWGLYVKLWHVKF